jgi:hypothetical protein
MTGHAISFATPDQRKDIRNIERLIRKALTITKTPALEKAPKSTDSERYFGEQRQRPSSRRPGSSTRESFVPSRNTSKYDRRSSQHSSRSPRPGQRPVRRRYEPQKENTGSNVGIREDSFYMPRRKPKNSDYDQF